MTAIWSPTGKTPARNARATNVAEGKIGDRCRLLASGPGAGKQIAEWRRLARERIEVRPPVRPHPLQRLGVDLPAERGEIALDQTSADIAAVEQREMHAAGEIGTRCRA
ncbi:MAG: hypothetical protein WDM94_13565 [Bauldia sp.]